MKNKFGYLVGFAALLVAGCAAYYSVYGLSQLFAGASLAVIIMASCLEFSKVIGTSLLHRYWSKLAVPLRIYLSIGIFILVIITSGGIYGFLSNAYQQTASKLEIHEGEVAVFETKKTLFVDNISGNEKIINSKNKRIDQLTNLRLNQENRLDSAKTNGAKNRVRKDIDEANKEIQKLTNDIDVITHKNNGLTDSIGVYNNKILTLKSKSGVAAELGPLKYLAQLTKQPMDKIVNYFILLLIFVFDPLAVCLVLATNRIFELERIEKTKVIEEINEKQVKDLGEKIKEELVNTINNNPIPIEKPIEETKTTDFENYSQYNTQPVIKENNENIIQEPIEPESDISVSSRINNGDMEEINNVKEEPIVETKPNEEIVLPDEREMIDEAGETKYIINEPVIPTGKVERDEIKEIKLQNRDRGFSVNIPHPKSKTEITKIVKGR